MYLLFDNADVVRIERSEIARFLLLLILSNYFPVPTLVWANSAAAVRAHSRAQRRVCPQGIAPKAVRISQIETRGPHVSRRNSTASKQKNQLPARCQPYQGLQVHQPRRHRQIRSRRQTWWQEGSRPVRYGLRQCQCCHHRSWCKPQPSPQGPQGSRRI